MSFRVTAAALVLASSPLATLSFAAEEAAPIVRGTAGMVEVPFSAANRGPGAIVCSATLAHWYSSDLGQAAPGGRVEASLWFDPQNGTTVLLNSLRDRMPVQALWCGFAGRSWATRTSISLERKANAAPSPIRVTCAPEGERLSCR